MPFPTAEHVNLPACSSNCPFMVNVKKGNYVNTNFTVNGLTRLLIKPESTASEANALTTRPFELLSLVVLSHTQNLSCRLLRGDD